MAEIGKYNELQVIKLVDFGVYLDGGELDEILLPMKYVPADVEIGDSVRVFIYLDSEDRIIATTQTPLATVGEFAFLKVVSNTDIGVFLDWGLEKDLFVPFREQNKKLITGHSYVFYVYLDEQSGRIAASDKLHKYISRQGIKYSIGQEVSLLVYEETPIGLKAIINHTHAGIIYKNEVYGSPLNVGSGTTAYINKLREDGKIDLTMQRQGIGNVLDFTEKIIAKLEEQGGFISLNDKSSPELIYEVFGVSKKVFKKAVGSLYKQRRIKLVKDGIEFLK